jgi:hypothetical protein
MTNNTNTGILAETNSYPTLTDSMYLRFYSDILDFRRIFDLPCEQKILSYKDEQLHAELLKEELIELATAKTRADKIDAITDSIYVLVGDLVHSGIVYLEDLQTTRPDVYNLLNTLVLMAQHLQFNILDAWFLVHKSNLSKVVTKEYYEQTLQQYEKLGVSINLDPLDKKLQTQLYGDDCSVWICSSAKHTVCASGKIYPKGKILKSAGYTPVDLTQL